MLLQLSRTASPRGFRLVGEMDVSNVGALRSALEPEIGSGGDITLDLSGLAFMDSSGIQAIIDAALAMRDGATLHLVQPGDLVRRTLEHVRLGQLANVAIRQDGA